MTQPIESTPEAILAHRMHAQNLTQRVPRPRFMDSLRACGIRNPAPDSAVISLAARVEGFYQRDFGALLMESQAIVQAVSIRSAIRVFPREDFDIFTKALFPGNEDELRYYIAGAEPALVTLGLSATQVLVLVSRAVDEVLQQQMLTKHDLGLALALRIGQELTPAQQEVWRWPSSYAQGQSLGESLARFMLPVVALEGKLCLFSKPGHRGTYYALSTMLPGFSDEKPQRLESTDAQKELVRRYLHCFGPATEENFAAWAGISLGQAQRLWMGMEPLVQRVTYQTVSGWMLQEDVQQLGKNPIPEGVRLLPPHDPWLHQHDRSLIVQGKHAHRYFWKSAGSPGMVLFDGEGVAGWQLRILKNKLLVAIEDIGLPIRRASGSELKAEASRLADTFGLESQGYTINSI